MASLETISNHAVEKIKKRYELEGADVAVAQVVLPEKMRKSFYATFDSIGVTIYDYTEHGELIEFGSLSWEDFPEVKIKHFKNKTSINFFAEDRFRKLDIIDESGRKVEQFLNEHQYVNIHIAELKWYNKIPGFRTETRWKMIFSAIIYLWIIGLFYNLVIQ